jgi:hypothetical protein
MMHLTGSNDDPGGKSRPPLLSCWAVRVVSIALTAFWPAPALPTQLPSPADHGHLRSWVWTPAWC